MNTVPRTGGTEREEGSYIIAALRILSEQKKHSEGSFPLPVPLPISRARRDAGVRGRLWACKGIFVCARVLQSQLREYGCIITIEKVSGIGEDMYANAEANADVRRRKQILA